MEQTTFRPLNECGSCGYTWNPRGHDLSNQCPSCGAGEVTAHKPDWTLILITGAVVLVGWFGFLGIKHLSDNTPKYTTEELIAGMREVVRDGEKVALYGMGAVGAAVIVPGLMMAKREEEA